MEGIDSSLHITEAESANVEVVSANEIDQGPQKSYEELQLVMVTETSNVPDLILMGDAPTYPILDSNKVPSETVAQGGDLGV